MNLTTLPLFTGKLFSTQRLRRKKSRRIATCSSFAYFVSFVFELFSRQVRESQVNELRVQSLIEIPEDVFDIFQPDTQTDEIRADAGRKLFCFG